MTENVRQDVSLGGGGLVEEEQIIEERTAPPRERLDDQALHEPISILSFTPPLCVGPHTSVSAAVKLMQDKGIGGILVEEDNRLVGIFTERDLLNKLIGSNRDFDHTPVAEVMTADPEVLPVDAEIAFALRLMGEGGFRRIPLVDDEDRPVGILSVKHIISYLAEFFPQEILNLPPVPKLLNPDQIASG